MAAATNCAYLAPPQQLPSSSIKAALAAGPSGDECFCGHVYFAGNISKGEIHQYCTGSFAKHMRQATCSLSFGSLSSSCKHIVKYAVIIEAVGLTSLNTVCEAYYTPLFLIKGTLDLNHLVCSLVTCHFT